MTDSLLAATGPDGTLLNISPPKLINTDQLIQELAVQSFTYAIYTRSVAASAPSQPAPPEIEAIATVEKLNDTERALLQNVAAAHVAMRDKTDAEYAAEFQASTDPARKQEIRDQMNDLLPREQVPM